MCIRDRVKAIEAAGLPVVHMCTVTPISMTVGANRIVPTIAIPHPLGNPALDKDEEYAPVSYTHLDVYKRQPWITCRS